MSRKHKSSKEEVSLGTIITTMIRANVMAYVLTASFVLLASLILTYTEMSPKLEGIIVILGIIASSFLAGFDTAKVEQRNGYKWGAIGGVVYFVTFLILGTMIQKLDQVAPGMILMLALIILITSTIAGMISVNCD